MKGPVSQGLFEFVSFGIKQAWACLFGGVMLALLLLTHFFYPEGAGLSRYDFLVIAAIALQGLLLLSGLETWEEARVIFVFHVVGTVMELFKTSAGSWIYPEESFLRIGAVPLFSGFMYAAVGSYLARVWRIFEFRFTRFPPLWLQGLLAAAIYVNFFAHHWTVDIRFGLFAATALIYLRTTVWFRPDEAHRPMPLLIGFLLVAIFIWFAENLGTFARAWAYPGQENGWEMVSLSKLGSWYLLMIISFVLVASVHRGRGGKTSDHHQAARR
ncbi:putative membrane protein [Hyphomonas neptunium ATCC 15444]|uniref:Putative membrane protein n=1 Tax=Hyphomonas neptunium (strain ATCC 15444) TaxID=228405 RepID=Q0C2P1_HYPNA|nr:putative membrane protein [Hyphomonas neptunium ATCC 15444]